MKGLIKYVKKKVIFIKTSKNISHNSFFVEHCCKGTLNKEGALFSWIESLN